MRRLLHDEMHRADEDALEPRRWGVDAVRFEPFLHGVHEVVLHLLERWVRVLQARARKVPLQVGVAELVHVATGATGAAGRAVRLPDFAEHELPEPECEALFADASGAVDQEAGGERPALHRTAEAVTQGAVAVKRDEGHKVMMVMGNEIGECGERQRCQTSEFRIQREPLKSEMNADV